MGVTGPQLRPEVFYEGACGNAGWLLASRWESLGGDDPDAIQHM